MSFADVDLARDIARDRERLAALDRESFLFGTQNGEPVGPFTREAYEDEIADGLISDPDFDPSFDPFEDGGES